MCSPSVLSRGVLCGVAKGSNYNSFCKKRAMTFQKSAPLQADRATKWREAFDLRERYGGAVYAWYRYLGGSNSRLPAAVDPHQLDLGLKLLDGPLGPDERR